MRRLDDTVRLLTDLLLPVMRYRMETLGVDGSGAFNFYRSRLQADRVFADYEVRLVERIMQDLPPVDEVHEIGCGWGQLVFLLAWGGYNAVGFEIDSRRFLGADYFRRVLAEIDQGCGSRAIVRNEFFPPLDRPEHDETVVISTNIVVSGSALVEEQMLWALRRYRYAIVDVDRFCRRRQPSERDAFLASVEQTGLRNAGLFCDADSEGSFYLFQRDEIGHSGHPSPEDDGDGQ